MLKYKVISDAIRTEIQEGKLKPGQKLPSIKSYATKLGVNADTIIKAYRCLEEEHLIYSVSKSGYYVVKSFIQNADKRKMIDLVSVTSPQAINPYKDFYHCMEKSIHLYKNRMFEYEKTQGMEELREILVKHLMNFQIFTKKENIVITNGAQQALYILAAMNDNGIGKRVVVEQPTYSVMLEALRLNHVPVVGIKRDKNGIDLTKLEEIFKQGGIKFFYTMPRLQNPTGLSYTKEQKERLLKLANKYDILIVEDDYLADLISDEKGDSLYAMGEKERIIYIRSFSKTLLPGLRLGMTIIPDVWKPKFIACKYSIDLNTPVLTQGALEIFLKSNMYQSHIVRTRKHYEMKMKTLKEACKQNLPTETNYSIPKTGIYAFIETKQNTTQALLTRLEKKKILASSVKNCFIEGQLNQEGIRLCVCNCKEEELKEAIKIISNEIKAIEDIKLY
jgi:DNA-binding transcriptional MocR family regulator